MGKIEERRKVSLKTAWMDFFKGYFDFKGRSTRAGYWWVQLFLIILSIIFIAFLIWPFFSALLTTASNGGDIDTEANEIIGKAFLKVLVPLVVGLIVALALLIPSVALTVRRNRDVGLRGRGQLVLWILYIILNSVTATNIATSFQGGAADLTASVNPAQGIWTLCLFILSVLPTGVLATRSENPILAFFFKNKSFYEDELEG